jgi:putative membrane protein
VVVGFGHLWLLILFILFNLVFWAGLVALAIWGVSRLSQRGSPDSALRILNERFARGEIDQQEYDQRRAALLRR